MAELDIYEGAEIDAVGSMYGPVEVEVALDSGGNKDRARLCAEARAPLGQAGSERRLDRPQQGPRRATLPPLGRAWPGYGGPHSINLPGLLTTKVLRILLSLPQILLVGLSVTQQQAALSGSFGALVLVWLQEQFHFKEGSHFFSTTDLFASQLPRSSKDRQYPLSLHS